MIGASAFELMIQAGETARGWMREAATFVEERFPKYPPTAKARLIAAYVQAAAADQHGMYIRALAEDAPDLTQAMRSLSDETAALGREIRRSRQKSRQTKLGKP